VVSQARAEVGCFLRESLALQHSGAAQVLKRK
jgi:hypothetical protein